MNTTEEKFSDNISTASEASETAGSGKYGVFPIKFIQGHFLKEYTLSEGVLSRI